MTFKKKIISTFIRPEVILIKARAGKNRVALTFDDGPDPRITPQVLDLLKKESVPATFFLIGKNLQENRELAMRIIQEGHAVGWHSFDHTGYQEWNYKKRKDDLLKGKELFRSLLNQECRYFRPPRGVFCLRHVLFCFSQGVTTVLWSQDSFDYKLKTCLQILDNINLKGIHDGDLWLFHDDHEVIFEILPDIIKMGREKNFEFVKVEEFLK